MKRWQYKSIVLSIEADQHTEEDTARNIDHYTNQYGEYGWDLLSIVTLSSYQGSVELLYTFKRVSGDVDE